MFSAFFSGTETAFISASHVKIEIWVRQRMQGARLAASFLEQPEHYLITTLIGNNIAMVAASCLMVYYMEKFIPVSMESHWRGLIITGMSAFLLLTLGEIIPKAICGDQPTAVAIRVSYLLRFVYYLLYPVIIFIRGIIRWMMKVLHINQEQSRYIFSRGEIDRLLREGQRAGVVETAEQDMISRFLLRGNFKVKDVMVPRTEMVAVQKNERIGQVKKILEDTGYSRLPVFGKNIDDVLGVITARDVILKRPQRIGQIMREILFVPESRNMGSYLREIQKSSPDMAIVVDEYGGTAGLVTLEDMVEEFFGDIQDEHDEGTNLYRKVSPRQIDVKARAEIHDLNVQHNLVIPEGPYNTLAGFLMDKMGHIPGRGERLDLPEYTFTILSATRRKIHWVRIHRKNAGS
ncbi:HlyC/CorC family transporter [bacterium]|nr:HlyC/CorC family transporter [bacterium]